MNGLEDAVAKQRRIIGALALTCSAAIIGLAVIGRGWQGSNAEQARLARELERRQDLESRFGASEAGLRKQVETLSLENANLSDEAALLRRKQEQYETSTEPQRLRVERLAAEKEDLERRWEATNARLKDVEEQNSTLKQQLAQTQDDVERLTGELQKQGAATNTGAAQLAAAQRELERMTGVVAQLQQQIAQLQQQAQQLVNERNALMQKLQRAGGH